MKLNEISPGREAIIKRTTDKIEDELFLLQSNTPTHEGDGPVFSLARLRPGFMQLFAGASKDIWEDTIPKVMEIVEKFQDDLLTTVRFKRVGASVCNISVTGRQAE